MTRRWISTRGGGARLRKKEKGDCVSGEDNKPPGVRSELINKMSLIIEALLGNRRIRGQTRKVTDLKLITLENFARRHKKIWQRTREGT